MNCEHLVHHRLLRFVSSDVVFDIILGPWNSNRRFHQRQLWRVWYIVCLSIGDEPQTLCLGAADLV